MLFVAVKGKPEAGVWRTGRSQTTQHFLSVTVACTARLIILHGCGTPESRVVFSTARGHLGAPSSIYLGAPSSINLGAPSSIKPPERRIYVRIVTYIPFRY